MMAFYWKFYVALLLSASILATTRGANKKMVEHIREEATQSRISINAPWSRQQFKSVSPFVEFPAAADIASQFSDQRVKRSQSERNDASVGLLDPIVDDDLNDISDERPLRDIDAPRKKTDKFQLEDEAEALNMQGQEQLQGESDTKTSAPLREAPSFAGEPEALRGPDRNELYQSDGQSDQLVRDELDVPLDDDSADNKPGIVSRNDEDDGVSPLEDQGYGGTEEATPTQSDGSGPTPRLSWLGQFLCSGRGPGWLSLNIILLILMILAALLSLYRLLGLRACTSLLTRTLYLFVMILCFTAAAFTAVHLIHLCFGGKEGLPLLLTLVLTHTPVPCLTVSLCLVLHSILTASRDPWPVSCSVVARISIFLVLLSVAGDIAVSVFHSAALLITIRVTLGAFAVLPVFIYLLKYCKIRDIHSSLSRELQGELKLMVPPTKDSVAYEQRNAQYLLRDMLKTWATLLFIACLVTLVLWGCNLSLSVFFAVSRVPVWLWWLCHTTNVLFQIILIVLLILACVITQEGRDATLCQKLFALPKDVFSAPSQGSPNGKRNFVYERVSYSSGPESSQRTSSSQNETDDSDNRVPVSMNPQSTPPMRPRVTLQRSATFNCAPRMPVVYGYPGYQHVMPQYYQRAGSYAQIHQPQAMAPSMLVSEAGFIRFNMPIQHYQYPVPIDPASGEMIKPNGGVMVAAGDPTLFQPPVDIEYNSLRRFPRRYAAKHAANNHGEYGRTRFNPSEIRMISPGAPQVMEPVLNPGLIPGSAPVSPYHALPLVPAFAHTSSASPAMSSFHPNTPSSAFSPDTKTYQSPPALPSRAGSFRNHYAAPPPVSPLASNYQVLPVASPSHPMNQSARGGMSSIYQSLPVQSPTVPPQYQRTSRPTSPALQSLAFPPPPPVPGNSPASMTDRPQSPASVHSPRLSPAKGSTNPESPYASVETAQFTSPGNYNPVRVGVHNNPSHSASSPPSEAELQLHQEKSVESTVREILTGCNRPVIRPRKHHLNSSGRSLRRNHSFKHEDPHGVYSNGASSNGFRDPLNQQSMDTISYAPDNAISSDELASDGMRASAPNLKRNHSTAGCYYPKDRKDSVSQTDDEGNKYSSFRLSQLRSKPADWYGTWAGRRKSKNGAYSVDTEKTNGDDLSSLDNKPSEKRLSSRASSILSIYNKLKSRKEKSSSKDDSSEGTEKEDRDDTEMSQASTFGDTSTPTPSEKTDGISITTEDEKDFDNPLAEALEEIKEKEQSDADWTMDILSSSSVLSDFYKLKSDRPPPLPELTEVDG